MAIAFEDHDRLPEMIHSRFVSGLWVEPTPRWIRGVFADQVVVNSTRTLLVYEPRRLPVYWFPREDVRMDLLSPARTAATAHSRTERWCLQSGERIVEHAGWSY